MEVAVAVEVSGCCGGEAVAVEVSGCRGGEAVAMETVISV